MFRTLSRGIVFVLLTTMFACDGHTSVHGHVQDSNGKPIEKASVTLETNGRKDDIETANDGSFEVGFTHAPTEVQLTLRATKPGFKPFSETFSSRSRPKGDHKITLERDS
jgi:hypothetical protein